MCCFVLVLGLLGPRLAFLWIWIVDTTRVSAAFGGSFVLPLLGVLFLPWTALAWVAAWAPIGGVTSIGYFVVALGFILDVATYSSRAAERYRGSSA